MLKNKRSKSGICLGAVGDTVKFVNCFAATDTWERYSDGQFKHKLSGKCLTMNSGKNDDKVYLNKCSTYGKKQQWKLRDLVGPWFQFESIKYPGKCMDVPGNSANKGQSVITYNCQMNNDHDYMWV
jgi:hypothetical protein